MSECDQEVGAVRGVITAARTPWRHLTASVIGRDIALVLALKPAGTRNIS